MSERQWYAPRYMWEVDGVEPAVVDQPWVVVETFRPKHRASLYDPLTRDYLHRCTLTDGPVYEPKHRSTP